MTRTPFQPGSRRTKLAKFNPGHVFWFPRGETWLNRDKRRPFALATPCGVTQVGTFVYGSTQETEKQAGAAFAEVQPIRTGISANGLEARTFFYPGILVRMEHQDLPPHAGVLGRSLKDMRAALATALGIGTGSCRRPEAPSGSRRGRIVVIEESFASCLRTRFAALLTEPLYSRETNYHLVVPIIRGDGLTAGAGVLTLREKEWLGVFPEPATSALLPVQVTQSAWYPDDIVDETSYVLDEETLNAVDSRLRDLFGLVPPEGGGEP